MELHPAIAQLVDQLAARRDVSRVILFGSRARGDNEERSDVDLAIDAPEAGVRAWFEMLDLAETAPTLLKIDMVRLEDAPDELRASIAAEGIELYAQAGG